MPPSMCNAALWQERIARLRAANLHLRHDLEQEISRHPRVASRAPRLSDGALEDLTPREFEVLRLIAEGRSTKEAADRLGIAFKTAACHRHRLMQKLAVHSTGALVRVAIAAGLVEV